VLERVIAEAEPQQTKAPLRLLIEEPRVNGRIEILPPPRHARPRFFAMTEEVGAG
jgi:hypothetical protein